MNQKNDDRKPIENDRKPLADVRLDAELMNELSASKGRDGRPLGELMSRHQKLVFNELRCRNIRSCDIDEVASMVWNKVWTMGRDQTWNADRARFSADSFVPLLKTICNSKAMDFHNRRKAERKRRDRILEAAEAWGDDWRARLGRAKRTKKAERPAPAGVPDSLAAAVAALPDRLRTAYELHANGLTNRKISELVGCSWGEVSRRLKAARQALAASPARRVG